MFGLSLHGWENAMVVFLLIAGFFALVSGVATWVVVRLQRMEIAKSEKEFEKYKLDTAKEISEANARAAEAKLELAKFKEPRLLSMEQQKKISEIVMLAGSVPFDFAIQVEQEAENLMKQIGAALVAGGWKWQPHSNPFFHPVDTPMVASVSYAGIAIQITESRRKDWTVAVNLLKAALDGEGVNVTLHQAVPDEQDTPNAIHIIVGRKP